MVELIRIDDSMFSAGEGLCRTFQNAVRTEAQGAISGEDPEHVHRMRIAVRKLRFILQFWAPLTDKKRAKHLLKELTWLARALGKVRDADVIGGLFKSQWKNVDFARSFKDFVGIELQREKSAARKNLSNALLSNRFERLFPAIETLFDRRLFHGEDLPLPIVIPLFIDAAVKKAARHAGGKLDYKKLHSLRIAFKRLRYTVEFFNTIYVGKLTSYWRQFKKNQDLLGRYCDARIAELFLNRLTAVSASGVSGGQFLQAGLERLRLLQRRESEKLSGRFEKKAHNLSHYLQLFRYRTKHAL